MVMRNHAEGPDWGPEPPPPQSDGEQLQFCSCAFGRSAPASASGQASPNQAALLMAWSSRKRSALQLRGHERAASPSTVAGLMQTMCVSANNITKVRFCSKAP